MVDKHLVARVFEEIADLLELTGANTYRIRAYRRAASEVKRSAGSLKERYEKGTLDEINGVGDALAKKIASILTTGTCQLLEELRKQVPSGLVDLLSVPGIGPKTAGKLYEELEASDLQEVEEAAEKGRIRRIDGLGAKVERGIKEGVRKLREERGFWLLSEGLALVEAMKNALGSLSCLERVEEAGSIRRRCSRVREAALLVSVRGESSLLGEGLLTQLRELSFVKTESLEIAETVPPAVVFETWGGLPVTVHVVQDGMWGSAIQHYTGSAGHNRLLDRLAEKEGLERTACGLDFGKAVRLEADVYRGLGLSYIPPELREGEGEVEAAMEGIDFDLVEGHEVKGDFHVHTDWSDGTSSLSAMVEEAVNLGYDYLAVADHSRSLTIANGLSVNRLREQIETVRRMDADIEEINLLTGVEVEILPDGQLDYPDSVLSELDVVVASVHSAFKGDEAVMTRRICKAMENRHVNIIAHPTGRRLGQRAPYPVDMGKVIAKARETKTVLEINASPDRLDLKREHVKRARDAGVKMAVCSDAHSAANLSHLKYGVMVARKGWLQRQDLMNTLDWDEIEQTFLC